MKENFFNFAILFKTSSKKQKNKKIYFKKDFLLFILEIEKSWVRKCAKNVNFPIYLIKKNLKSVLNQNLKINV